MPLSVFEQLHSTFLSAAAQQQRASIPRAIFIHRLLSIPISSIPRAIFIHRLLSIPISSIPRAIFIHRLLSIPISSIPRAIFIHRLLSIPISFSQNAYYDLQYVKDFEPERDVVTQLRVLLYGPIGAGKSSFINSVSTILINFHLFYFVGPRFRGLFSPIDSSPSPSPSPPPPPSPTFETPWRKLEWGNTYYDLQYVKDYEPERDVVTQLRVLLYGPIGAGKSSFINSVSTVIRGRMVNTALASATNYEEGSFTKKYETYKIRKESWGSYYPFVFNDIMGVEEGSGRGVRVEDIKLAMMGHVKENYKFNPVSPLSPSDSGYNAAPSLDDRVHVLVCVCSGNAADISESALKKMREIREAASELGIPQLLLVTKLDEACPETEKDLQNIYKSKFVKKKMTQLSSELGIPLNCILPVKNYSYETSQDEDVDTLILNALRLILDFGNDFIEKL